MPKTHADGSTTSVYALVVEHDDGEDIAAERTLSGTFPGGVAWERDGTSVLFTGPVGALCAALATVERTDAVVSVSTELSIAAALAGALG